MEKDIEKLKATLLKKTKPLPPMPQIMFKAREVILDENTSFRDIGKVLESDQAMATRVLKLANSAYYGLSGRVSSIQQACSLLGTKMLYEMITVVSTSKLLGKKLKGYNIESNIMWRHSMAVAFGSKIIAVKVKPDIENDAFSAGLIHDAGKLMLDPFVFEKQEDFNKFLSQENKNFLDAEQELLGFDHSEIASEFCLSWKIPEQQTIAIRYHHKPSDSNQSHLSYILHAADIISIQAGLGTGEKEGLYQIEEGCLEFIKLNLDDIDNIKVQMAEAVNQLASELNIP